MDERFDATGLVRSDRYGDTMESVVLPYLKSHEEDLTVKGAGDKPLFASFFTAEAPRGTVAVVHGFTENAYKFSEVIYSLLQNGYNVCAYDQRGHGRSWRDPAVEKDLSLTHVTDFNDYVEDLRLVLEAVKPKIAEPLMVFSHSMGGAVVGLFLEKYPGVFKKAVFCAPMIAPRRNGLSLRAALLLCGTAKLLGRGTRRLMLSKPYAGPEDFETSCATGRERFDWYDAVRVAQPLFHNNGPTYDWTNEALKVTGALLAPGAVEKITIPVKVYTAENDTSVLGDEQVLFAQRLVNGERVRVKGSRHEIYRSGDDAVFPWWKEVLDFYRGNEG